MLDNIKADLSRYREGSEIGSAMRIFVRGLMSQGFQALIVYRFFRWCHVHGIPTQPFRFFFERFIEIITGISIPAEADIGKGLRIHHFGGIVFHSHVKMGENCTIYHGVTFGDKGGSGEPPIIGHHVLVGAGAKVLGDITIGNNVTIGANAVVIRSVPDNMVVGGVPAKVIRRNSEKRKHNMKQPQEILKKPINVMQCRSTYTTGGGPDKTALLIAEKTDPDRFKHVLMYMRGVHDTEFQIGNWARAKGLTIHEVLEYKKLDWSNINDARHLIKQYRIHILHARDYKTCVVGYLATLFNPSVKRLFTAHLWQDKDSLKMKFYTWLNLLLLRRYHKIIAVSDALKQFMITHGVPAEKITVIHNAIDTEAWQRSKLKPTIREELNIPASSKIVGVVGRLRYEKDLPTTLKVADRVLKKLPGTYFLIVGDGPEKDLLEQQVKQMGIAGRVLFLGFRRDTMQIYAVMDAFLSTARIEGTPNTALEAMAMEVPVLYTNVGGVGELIRDGHDGLLFQVGDVGTMAKALLEVLTDENKARNLRENGRKTVCEKFSFTARLKAVEATYTSLISGESS